MIGPAAAAVAIAELCSKWEEKM